ncbi:MAG: TetR/AcrR family transcriptional regulator [Oscillospiraceae bacterium]
MRDTATQVRIKETLLKMLEVKPIHQIQVKALAAELGIGRSTFYAYYDSVYDLLQEIEDDFFANIHKGIHFQRHASDRTEDLLEQVRKVFKYIYDNGYLFRVLTGPTGDPAFLNRFQRRIQQSLLECYPKVSRETRYFEETCYYIAGGETFFLSWWIRHLDEISLDEICNICFHFARSLMKENIALSQEIGNK